MTAQFIKLLEVFGIRKKLRKITDTETDLAIAGNTAVTGTLSATGKISTSSSAGGRVISAENNTNTNQTQMQVNNTNGRYEAGVLTYGHAYAGSITAGANFHLYAGNTDVAQLSPTGLAVTGLLDLSAATSGQIKFPASQNASTDANTLDDYEEGTWTPTYKTTGTNFDSVTYALAFGKYTKIGRMVTVVGLLRTSAITVGGATGTVLIGGLPFTSSGGNYDYATVPIGTSSGFAANHPSAGRASAGTTSLELLYRDAPDGATNDLAITDLGTGASANTLSFSCTYHV